MKERKEGGRKRANFGNKRICKQEVMNIDLRLRWGKGKTKLKGNRVEEKIAHSTILLQVVTAHTNAHTHRYSGTYLETSRFQINPGGFQFKKGKENRKREK